jgi:hypothetical protein
MVNYYLLRAIDFFTGTTQLQIRACSFIYVFIFLQNKNNKFYRTNFEFTAPLTVTAGPPVKLEVIDPNFEIISCDGSNEGLILKQTKVSFPFLPPSPSPLFSVATSDTPWPVMLSYIYFDLVFYISYNWRTRSGTEWKQTEGR